MIWFYIFILKTLSYDLILYIHLQNITSMRNLVRNGIFLIKKWKINNNQTMQITLTIIYENGKISEGGGANKSAFYDCSFLGF